MPISDTTWPFGADADRDDPLTALRIAVTDSHPNWGYLVAFDRESEARPTDAEARMLASFLEEYKAYWYNLGYLAKMAEKQVDVDGGANGVIFHKFGDDDWGYRRHLYTRGWTWSVVWPGLRDRDEYRALKNAGPFSLSVLMDRVQGHGDEPSKRWLDWKAAHPEVFGYRGGNGRASSVT